MTAPRRFLMLQGPHGPFFRQLAQMLREAGNDVWRVGFNSGDRLFASRLGYLPFTAPESEWEDWLNDVMEQRGITDVVLYGEPRDRHQIALRLARKRGLRTHIFEEGYLRPYWVTYEREGTNGHSRLMDLSLAEIKDALGNAPTELPEAPATWGEMRQHILYGALYHAGVLAGRRQYPEYRSHRTIPVSRELRLHLRRLLLMPLHRIQRSMSLRRLKRGGFPYHLVLLQLAHDASFQTYSGFERIEDFLELVLRGFADGAPTHHHLVFKAHPLEDGRTPIARDISRLSQRHNVADRVHLQISGKLAPLLDGANSAITVNSTAAQQALWRGLPVKALGQAVYAKPEFVSDQPMPAFFAHPDQPDLASYRSFRQFLLKTSQFRGGFYSSAGRRTLLRQIVDAMLSDTGRYEIKASSGAAGSQHVRLIG